MTAGGSRRSGARKAGSAAPEVSVIVPVFNREALLEDCLRSIQRQSLQAWECLVVDDGSSDASLEVARRIAAEDPRFRVSARTVQNKGAGACRNEALARAQGRYVMFLDSDDLLAETCLAERVEAFAARPDRDFLVFRTAAYFEQLHDRRALHNVDKDAIDLLRFLRLDNPWPINGPLWKREQLVDVGGFDESLPSWQDWQLHVNALLAGKRYEKLANAPDSFIRIKGDDRIGGGAWSERHVTPKAAFVMQLAARHRAQLVRDPSLRSGIAGVAWHLIARLDEVGLKRQARAHWTRLWRLGYVGFGVWREGLMALLLHGRPGGGICWSAVARWPRTAVGGIDTSTMMSVPY